MPDLKQNLDHAGVAFGRLAQQFRGKPKLAALLSLASKQSQDIENALWGIFIGTQLDNAVGVTLARMGRIVGQERGNSVDDNEYRARIRARVKANLSSGTVPEILDVFLGLLGTLANVTLVPSFPAGLWMTLTNVITVPYATLYMTYLRAAKAAGVYAVLEYFILDDAHSFMCEPLSAFMLGPHASGVTSFTVEETDQLVSAGPSRGAWPAAGSIILDRGTANEETVAYSSITFVFSLSGIKPQFNLTGATTKAHFQHSNVAGTASAGLGFPVCCFQDGDAGIGDTEITVFGPAFGSTAGFPASGTIIIGSGTSEEETIAYSSVVPDTAFELASPLLKAHSNRSSITLPTSGGGLAGAFGV